MKNRQPSRNQASTAVRSQRTPSGPRTVQSGTGDTANSKRSYEHYMALGRAAASAGNVIEAESLYQRAEHQLKKLREGGD